MTPKSLLRHPKATSPVSELSNGGFSKVLPDTAVKPADVKRVVLCTGKVYYDLLAGREQAERGDVALVRVELLYPFPAEELAAALKPFGQPELVWAQEEPRNMGAWSYIAPYIRELTGRDVKYTGRPLRASPAEGYAEAHEAEQKRIVTEALELAATPKRGRKQKQT
jgi:2-oxoglutarate dehydrogenase complex dehydrogenase (E1) component-like enzyme